MREGNIREAEMKGKKKGGEGRDRHLNQQDCEHTFLKTRDHFLRRSHISGVTQSSLGSWQT